jgi:ATP-binding cassette subfamily G (WHITE) protein 2 (SNQ2)
VVASNLLPFVLPILAIVSGIIVPQESMPALFRYFVYYANPVAYFVRGQVSVILHGLTIDCIAEDIYNFNPPPGQTCAAYAGDYITSIGGQLFNGDAMSNCGFCQYATSDQFAQTLSADYNFRWQNYGIFLGFTIAQLFAAYGTYWYFSVKGYGLGISKVIALVTGLFSSKNKDDEHKE